MEIQPTHQTGGQSKTEQEAHLAPGSRNRSSHRSNFHLECDQGRTTSHLARSGRNPGSGFVNLTRRSQGFPQGGLESADASDLFPIGKCSFAKQLIVNRLEMVTAQSERVLNGSVHGENPLSLGRRLEPAHAAFSFPGGLVRDLRPVVFVLTGSVND